MNRYTPENDGDGRGQPSLADDLRSLVRIFWVRWRMIAVIMAVFLVMGQAYIWLSAPVFTATTQIFIDPRQRSLVDQNAVPTGMGSSSQGADLALLDSQITILKSRQVLTELIEKQDLEADPEFTAVSSGPVALAKAIGKALVYGPNAGDYGSSQTPFERAFGKLADAIAVTRVDQTYVLDISVNTRSPEKSARLANALAETYLADGQSASDESVRETAQSLESRLAELGKKSEQSQQAVEDYRQAHGLMDAQGALVDERQLTELSAQAVSASVAAESARVTLDSLKRDGAEAATSDVIKELQVQIDQAQSSYKALASSLGPRHPKLRESSQTVASLEASLDAELARVIKRAEDDYDKAKQTETSLKALLARSTDALAQSNTASVKLKELQQIADQDKALYDSFANKAKQMRQQISLPTTTARVISVAQPPARPSAPRVPLILAISLFLGGVAGFGTAWAMHIFFPSKPVRKRPLSVVKRDEHPTIAAQ